jgi:hypothetical protein
VPGDAIRLRKAGINAAGRKDTGFRAQPWEQKPPSAKQRHSLFRKHFFFQIKNFSAMYAAPYQLCPLFLLVLVSNLDFSLIFCATSVRQIVACGVKMRIISLFSFCFSIFILRATQVLQLLLVEANVDNLFSWSFA